MKLQTPVADQPCRVGISYSDKIIMLGSCFSDNIGGQLADLGFDAVTFMPSRNTPAQLDRLMAMCEEKGFFQISGEDINTPRQSFMCKAYENPKFQHLVDAAFMLIAYENAAAEDIASAKKQYPQMFRY